MARDFRKPYKCRVVAVFFQLKIEVVLHTAIF